ncbi:PREDICTED: uncharacterized protein LOC104749244 [Camelina sativa]|uniref:Uncharacterized protein LOC104749244 n=1 Tax=Camelina sativa TaxID=90675 RepID=A0ABM0WCK5_CAMSA|nr:PREDICTED: uncharacterized protein LOC104749244 [Camelina sativa]
MSSSPNESAATVSDTIVANAHTFININMSNVPKLTPSNYLMWSLQVHALLDGYGFVGHLDGSTAAPPTTTTVADVVTANPAFQIWSRQDCLIYSALLGAISLSQQPIVARAVTTHEVWTTLASTYANPSRGHILQLKTQLKHWTKGDKTIEVYLQGLVTRFDQLAILGKPEDLEDQIEMILDGLPEEYRPVIDQVEGRDTPSSITYLHERLINHESKLLAATSAYLSPHSTPPAHFHPNNRGSRPYLGRCQICGTQGHSARRCPQFQPLTTQSNSHSSPWQPRANLAASAPLNANQWILDSGATHHITSDLQNLALHQPYHGGDGVVNADGSSTAITHTGSLLLPSPSRILEIHKVLCVPNIKKNLVSVYRLCNANQVSVGFFPTHFQVKDLSTGSPSCKAKPIMSYMSGQ